MEDAFEDRKMPAKRARIDDPHDELEIDEIHQGVVACEVGTVDSEDDSVHSFPFPETPPIEGLEKNSMLCVLEYLRLDDLDSFAVCNRLCRKYRAHKSLDQTKTATFRFAKDVDLKTILYLYNRIHVDDWSHTVFRDNRTRFRIKGLELLDQVPRMDIVTREAKRLALPNVKLLDISTYRSLRKKMVKLTNLKALALILPNLEELDADFVRASSTLARSFLTFCPNLRCIRWKGCRTHFNINGFEFRVDATAPLNTRASLTELYLSETTWWTGDNGTAEHFETNESILDRLCQTNTLERLDLKGAEWYPWRQKPQPFTDKMLCKLVRSCTSLKWLRSDLSPECIAVLKVEKPDMEFVS